MTESQLRRMCRRELAGYTLQFRQHGEDTAHLWVLVTGEDRIVIPVMYTSVDQKRHMQSMRRRLVRRVKPDAVIELADVTARNIQGEVLAELLMVTGILPDGKEISAGRPYRIYRKEEFGPGGMAWSKQTQSTPEAAIPSWIPSADAAKRMVTDPWVRRHFMQFRDTLH